MISMDNCFLPIALICYIIAEFYKIITCKKTNEIYKKIIPFGCGLLGGIIGTIIFITEPDAMIVEDGKYLINYIAGGIISGLASTGIDQAIKQFKNED